MPLEFYWDEAGDPRARPAAHGADAADRADGAPAAGSADGAGDSPAADAAHAAGPAADMGAPGRATTGGAAAAAAARYLESDVQGSVSQAREIVHVIDRILAGRLHTWCDTGNAHTLTLTRRGATIELEADGGGGKPTRLSLADTRQAVADWLAFLQRGRGAAAAPPPPTPPPSAAG